MRAGDATVDFAEQDKRVHRLFVVNRDIYAAGTSMAKAVLKPGLKVLLFIEGQNGRELSSSHKLVRDGC